MGNDDIPGTKQPDGLIELRLMDTELDRARVDALAGPSEHR
jgi:hypothetical protein